MTEKKIIDMMYEYGYNKIGPVLFDYTSWIITECRKRGINKIYFLARDGFLLQKIAKQICKQKGFKIDCRYLCCSRLSLRIPTYHFIGEEAYDSILYKGFHVTPDEILNRVGFSVEIKNKILKQLNVIDKDKELNKSEFYKFANGIKNNKLFLKELKSNSKKAYETTIGYLKQEKVFDDSEFVIVDSGWIGSVQHSFKKLFESQNFNPKITGFYFGLYKKVDKNDGEFLTYYFDANSHIKNKIMFDNNVFECLLLSNSGMTEGYKKDKNGIYKPLYRKTNYEMKDLIDTKNEAVIKYCNDHVGDFDDFDYKKSLKKNYKILKKMMLYPSSDEVEIFNNIYFCNDISELSQEKMLDRTYIKYLKKYTLFPIIKRVFFNAKGDSHTLYWPYGVVFYVNPILKPWYMTNLKFVNFLKSIIKK